MQHSSPEAEARVQAFPTHPTVGPCRRCDGEGTVETEKPGGTWNRYIGTWEPDVYLTECEECRGSGEVDADRCDRCGLASVSAAHAGCWDACSCDEDTLRAWQLAGGDPEVSEAAANAVQMLKDRWPDGGLVLSSTFRTDCAWASRVRTAAFDLREDWRGITDAERALARTLAALATDIAAPGEEVAA